MADQHDAKAAPAAQQDPLQDECGGDLNRFLSMMTEKNPSSAVTHLVLVKQGSSAVFADAAAAAQDTGIVALNQSSTEERKDDAHSQHSQHEDDRVGDVEMRDAEAELLAKFGASTKSSPTQHSDEHNAVLAAMERTRVAEDSKKAGSPSSSEQKKNPAHDLMAAYLEDESATASSTPEGKGVDKNASGPLTYNHLDGLFFGSEFALSAEDVTKVLVGEEKDGKILQLTMAAGEEPTKFQMVSREVTDERVALKWIGSTAAGSRWGLVMDSTRTAVMLGFVRLGDVSASSSEVKATGLTHCGQLVQGLCDFLIDSEI